MTKPQVKEFTILFAVQCLSYFLITMNQRAIAQGLYFWTGMTDLFFAGVNFAVIKKIATSAPGWAPWAGYTFGGVAGSLLGIWLTTVLYGQ
jgi:hypothetical protein